MKENIEEDIIKKNGNPQNVDLITLLRQFKREGIENFIVLRKNNFDNILSDYKRALKENEELEHKYDKALSDLVNAEKENEKLKRLIAHRNRYTQQLEKDLFENCSNYVISKQKINDKIEELKKWIYTGENAPQDFLQYRIKAKIQVLQDLLEEKGE